MMKEQIIEILEDIQPEADYETCQTLIPYSDIFGCFIIGG